MMLTESDAAAPVEGEKDVPHAGAAQAHRIAIEQVRLLYDHAFLGLATTFATTLLTCYVLWTEVAHVALLIWAGFIGTVSAYRLGVVLRFRAASRRQRQHTRWRRLFVIGAAMSGIGWGALGALLLSSSSSLVHQVFLAVVLAGMAAGGVPLLSSVASAYRSFVVPALAPFAALLLLHGDQMHLIIGLMTVLYLVMMLISSTRIHHTICESLELRFEYDDLIKDLRQTKSELLSSNRELAAEVRERRATADTLRESEERFRTLSEAAFEGILIHEDGIIRDANQVLADMLGHPMADIVGKSVFNFADERSHERILESITRRPEEPFEIAVRRRDGDIFAAEVRGKDIPIAKKRLRVVAVQDITARKLAESRLRDSEQRLSAILNNLEDTLYRTDTEGRLIWISPSVRKLLGYSVDELIGQRLADLYVEPEIREAFLDDLMRAGGRVTGHETALRHKDGTLVWVSTNAHYFYSDSGAILGVEGASRDITELKHAERALHEEKERALVTLESIGDGVVTTNVDGRVSYLNPVAEQLTGWNTRDAVGRDLREVMYLADESSGEAVDDPVIGCMAAGRSVCLSGQTTLVHRSGDKRFSIEVTASPIRDRDRRTIGAVLVFHDVTALRGMARQLSYQASHDPLTALINRREFEVRLEQAIETAREGDVQHAMCYMDLDQFKVVNDTCGHQAGDELLRRLAALLDDHVRGSDSLARLGGDEFGLLLLGCPVDKAHDIAEHMRQAIREFRFLWDDKVFEVGVSTGLVPIDRNSGTLSDVLSAADSACYVAKDQGRNRIHIFQPDDTALAQHHGHMQWLQKIQRALERDSFELFFQPIIGLSANAADGLYGEVLLRMRNEDGTIATPYVFIPAAERYHLMPEIDRWVLSQALAVLKESGITGDEEAHLMCTINLSGQSLCEEDFLNFTVKEIEQSGVCPKCLCFEITETAAIGNFTFAERLIHVLRGMGCRFALDDFGSGLSSFSYLKRLPVDFLKIDGSFVRGVRDDELDRAMIAAICQIGQVMGIQTIAEFVENDAVLAMVKALDIDFAQGYGVGQPQPLSHALAALRKPR